MKHLDLFSGIGGFSLASDTVFPGIEHEFVEYDTFCQEILKKHWPNSTIHGDINTFIADTERQGRQRPRDNAQGQHGQPDRAWKNQDTHIVTGGFPCQPFSAAGRRNGTDDDRYLWPQMFRVVQLYKPTWVIAENVYGLVTWNGGMVLETVCSDLESEGYEVQPFIIPACAKDAPHRRDRVWIIANREHERQTQRQYEGRPRHQEALSERDDKNSPYQSDVTYSRPQRRSERADEGVRPQRVQPSQQEYQHPDWSRNWQEVAFATCHDGVDDGLSRRLGESTISRAKWRQLALKAYGNAIVPQVAMEVMRAINQTNK